jgi:RNA polymerase sigma-70 factor (ECF subfamily)
MLRSRKSRREEPMAPDTPEPVADSESAEREANLADSLGPALLVVLETLAPPERLAFVLHDMFAVPFDDIAPIVGRSVEATRQLASRARRRVQGKDVPDADLARQRKIVDAFLKASRESDFEALIAVLDPNVVFRPDAVAAKMGNQSEARGAQAVAALFKGRAQAARPAMADGAMALAVVFGGQLRIVLGITFSGERITAIDAIADPEHIAGLDIALLNT